MTKAKLKSNTRTSEEDRHLIAGRYRTFSRIGHGRLGEIFAATDESYEEPAVEQHLAIQVIPESVVSNNRLFNKLNLGYTELMASAHPNIVDYRHFGRYGKFGFLVMELLDGASLRLVLDDAETLPLEEVRPVIRGVGEALRLLHAKDMVHGNLTTRNVLITEQLEVRLLDVLPLDPAEAIVRGIATSDPFSRCTVEDDVFGLACLAYEMLAGKHPFNYSTAAEARLAGLEAERIDSLTGGEWNALILALSFDREQRTSSVADFMRDFGIKGTERLRPTEAQPAAPAPIATTAIPVAAIETVSLNDDKLPNARRIQKGRRSMRAVFLGILLAELSAWSYFGQPEEHVVNLISYLDERMDVGLTEHSDAMVNISAADPARPISTDRVAQADDPAVAAPVATLEATLEESEAMLSEPELSTSDEGMVSAQAQPTDQPAPAASPADGDTTETSAEATNPTADESPADTDADPMLAETELVVTESVVSVSEGDGAARIATQRIEDSETPLIWWTSEHTANTDKDFISVKQKTMANVSTEDSHTLHVPLVDDSVPEPRESFFVNVGFRNTHQGQIERIATVRVDIIDDDLP